VKNDPSAHQRAPWHLWLVGTIGLLWNSVGVFDYVMTQTRNETYMARLNPDQIAALNGFPTWLVGFWALAVWAGMLGALAMLLRRRMAAPVLLVSLVAMSVTAVHNFISANGLYASGGTSPAFVMLIFGIAAGLWLYSRSMGQRQILA
jgi:hypothetical protein